MNERWKAVAQSAMKDIRTALDLHEQHARRSAIELNLASAAAELERAIELLNEDEEPK